MKPFLVQQFFARAWPWLFVGLGLGIPLCFTVIIAVQAYPDWKRVFTLVFICSTGGILATWFMLRASWLILSKINGAPFHKGDEVQIISGSYKGKTATVYEVWKERGQVRLDLGEQAKKAVTDVFSFIEVYRGRRGP